MTSTSAALPAHRPAPAARSTIGLFVFVVLAWSLNWVVMKLAVHDVAPLWAVTTRTALAAAVLFPILRLNRQLVRPPRGDYPIILVISLFHMVGFAALMTIGLTYVSAGRAIVLGYTTPLWVAPAAFVFLKERMSIRQIVGIGVGMAGLLLLVGPGALDWRSQEAMLGNGLPVLAAICWSVSIVYTRAHRWTATPLQLMPTSSPARCSDNRPITWWSSTIASSTTWLIVLANMPTVALPQPTRIFCSVTPSMTGA